ncbi:MAG: GNAT family N-acetyltransferase [Bacteroidota bacterium]
MKNYWQGKRIALRGLEPSDAPFFLEWNQETLTQQNLDQIWFPSSLARVEEWAHKQALKPVDDDSYFFVITQLSGEPVGMIHTNDCDKKNGHFGYGLGVTADHRKMGYASEAIRMVLSYYFNQLRYHKAIVGVYGFNEASIPRIDHFS